MYRLQYAERKVYIFLMHIRSRVCFFVCLKYLFGKRIALCTRRDAFCFSWKALEYESNGKFSKTERRIFYDDRNNNTFKK